jgi:RNA polymerase sigma-70 factor (ECF subfamily)
LPTANAPAPAAGPATALDGFRTGLQRYLRALGAGIEEAEELTQEVLVVGCSAVLPACDAAARAFLRGVARNHWLRTKRWWRRRREREVAVAVDELWQATAAEDDGEALLLHLRECFALLQARTRRALELHYHDGLDWQQVSAQIGLRPNGTKTLVQRARQALRTCIERRQQ